MFSKEVNFNGTSIIIASNYRNSNGDINTSVEDADDRANEFWMFEKDKFEGYIPDEFSYTVDDLAMEYDGSEMCESYYEFDSFDDVMRMLIEHPSKDVEVPGLYRLISV